MIGDYTKVPLRRTDRWSGALAQAGRPLLDHEWNLTVDALARAERRTAAAVIGPAGVPAGSGAFSVSISATGTLQLTMGTGGMWVDGMMADAPQAFTYSSQDQIAALPTSGTALVYLDVFEEHVQPAEDPGLIDPALAPTDAAGRVRVGYRVRVAPTTATTCEQAFAALAPVGGSTGTLTLTRTGVVGPTDPCDPPGDPSAQVPDGLLRVEVLNAGSASAADFAWSYENGATAIPVVSFAGDTLTLAPSRLHLDVGDRVEVSWLARRADRMDHGDLYGVVAVTPAAGGDVVELDAPVRAPAGATGLVVRRWDGQVTGATTPRNATFGGTDLGVTFSVGAGTFQPGDWWGARLRAAEGDGVEHRTGAEPDGVRHAFAPLALVDLTARTVLHDCRPTFTPLVDIDMDRGACTVSVKPGDDLQAAVDALPPGGGELCLAAGHYTVGAPVRATGRTRIVVNGAGPATIVRAAGHEAAFVFDGCTEIEVRNLRAEGGTPPPGGEKHLDGALTFVSCRDVTVTDCVLACPDATTRRQTCLTVRRTPGAMQPDRVRITRNRLEVGAWQTGMLVLDVQHARVEGNDVLLRAGRGVPNVPMLNPAAAEALKALLRGAVRETRGTGVRSFALEGAEGPLHVDRTAEVFPIVEDFARITTRGAVRRARGAERALAAFGRGIAEGRGVETLSDASLAFLAALGESLRAVDQGIVVGGTSVGAVQVCDNVVTGVVQGIHVGVSHADVAGTESAGSVMVARNVIDCVVPVNHRRDRHAVFVGNADTIHVLDTVASLRRIGTLPEGTRRTPVEGIRIHGQLGQFMLVRQASLSGFQVGVRVRHITAAPNVRAWLVAEVAAGGASAGLDAPATVERERVAP